jgi:hypothetical protein
MVDRLPRALPWPGGAEVEGDIVEPAVQLGANDASLDRGDDGRR